MFTPFIRVILMLALGIGLSLPSHAVMAAEINPNSIETGIEVKNLTLEGFSSIEDYPLQFQELRAQLNVERARFGASMTVDELHQIADAMTVYVRKKGFSFHTIYLPPQRVEKGEVYLVLREGVLTDIHVLNQTSIPDRRIERVFASLKGKMLYAPEVEKRVAALKAQTGIRVFPFFSRGAQEGQARLNLRVDPTDKHATSLKFDNYGAETSGEYRLIGQWSIYQFSNRFDRLSLAVLASIDDVTNYYGSLEYERPFASLNYVWDLSLSNNQFELGDRFASLGLEGDATIVKTGISYNRDFTPTRREQWRLGWATKINNLDSDGLAVEEERSDAVSLRWSKAWQRPDLAFASNSYITLSQGNIERSAEDEDSFTKLDVSTQLLKGVGKGGRLHSVFSLGLSLQQTDVNLPSVETFALTGPYGVRGFVPGQFSADNALLVTAEWSLPNLLRKEAASWYLEPYVFFDWADGERLSLGDIPGSDGQFTGAGGGFRFRVGEHMSGQLYGAGKVNGEIDGIDVYGEQLWRFEIRLY